jgi:hypothetical protein
MINNDFVNATIDYINKFGYKKLTKKTKHIFENKSYNIGDYRAKQVNIYNKLETEKEREAMKKEFNCIHPDYLLNPQLVSRQNNINATIDFIEKFGYEKLSSITTHIFNNELYNIGIFRAIQRNKYNKLETEKEREAIKKEFDYINDDYLILKETNTFEDTFLATKDFVDNYGYDKLKRSTIHEYENVEYKIGVYHNKQRNLYFSLKTEKEREAMRKKFQVIHPFFLSTNIEVMKVVIADFLKENDIMSLKARTVHVYDDIEYKIGNFINNYKAKYHTLNHQEQKEMEKDFGELMEFIKG